MESVVTSLVQSLFIVLIGLLAPLVFGYGLLFAYRIRRYQRSRYYEQTKHPYMKVVNDLGLYGEYLCVAAIESRFQRPLVLTNLYLPHPTKKDRTTEIDVVLIHQSGIHIIESKNFSGWIFGRETDRYWTQTLPRRRKHQFFNPIKQNALHIKAVARALQLDVSLLHSWIVFSNRATLKRIDATVPVVSRSEWMDRLLALSEAPLTLEQQHAYFEALVPFTCVSDAVRQQHIEAMNVTKSPLS